MFVLWEGTRYVDLKITQVENYVWWSRPSVVNVGDVFEWLEIPIKSGGYFKSNWAFTDQYEIPVKMNNFYLTIVDFDGNEGFEEILSWDHSSYFLHEESLLSVKNADGYSRISTGDFSVYTGEEDKEESTGGAYLRQTIFWGGLFFLSRKCNQRYFREFLFDCDAYALDLSGNSSIFSSKNFLLNVLVYLQQFFSILTSPL